MASRFGRVTLRDLFWLILLAAMAVGWYLERNRARDQLAKYASRTPTWVMGPPKGAAVPSWRVKYLAELRDKSNGELTKLFDQVPPATAFHATDEYQCCLVEMARRGMFTELEARHEQALKTDPNGDQYGGPANGFLLTALRRAQGKPDPLRVEIEVVTGTVDGLANLPAEPLTFPGVQPTLINVDSEPIAITRGGDYRSGRQTRFRVHLIKEHGVRIGDSNWPQYGMGGGISSFGQLPPGEKIEIHAPLDARSYVKSPPSGRYQLQVVYAEQEIASDSDLTGLIVWQSTPVTVQVKNRTADFQQRFIPGPLIGLFFLLALLYRTYDVWRRRSEAHSSSIPTFPWNWRDLVALVMLLALAAGWTLELRSLGAEIAEVRPDREADWSMEVVKE